MPFPSTPSSGTPAISLRDRFRGCLLGLAAGDALGTAVEFRPPGSFKPVTGMTGGGCFHLQPGQWTDDTSMALCLADSLLECGKFDPRDQLDRYWRWYTQGYMSSNGRCFDIGGTTRRSLEEYQRTGEPYRQPDEHAAGNGSLMRLAPVVLFYAGDPRLAMEMAGDSSRTTHAAKDAVDACSFFAGLITGALNGVPKEALLSGAWSPVPDFFTGKRALSPIMRKVVDGSFKVLEPPEIAGDGYVVRSLEAALWAFNKSSSFEDGCLLAANLGDDADTVCAIYGQIAGAYYGVESIPSQWRDLLAMRELITNMADRLLEKAFPG